MLEPAKPLRSVPYELSCSGNGPASVRVSVVGDAESYPVPGLTLYTRGPEQPFAVSGGTTTPLIIDFGMISLRSRRAPGAVFCLSS